MRSIYPYKGPIKVGMGSAALAMMPPLRGGPTRRGLTGEGYQSSSAYPAKPKSAKPVGRKRRKVIMKKSNGTLSKDVSQLKAAVRDLRYSENATLGTLTFRSLNTYRILAPINSLASASYALASIATLESVLAQCKFFNPAVPGTLTTADVTSGTYQRNVLFKSQTNQLIIRNNYQSDCNIVVYLCIVKDDTDQTPLAAWDAGVIDGSNAADRNALNQYPSDYNVVKDLYSLKRVLKTTLAPGQSTKCSHTVNNVEYDPATADTHGLSYQKEYKANFFMVIIQGTISHDSVADEQGFAAAGVDIEQRRTHIVSYDAGINISYNYLSTGPDSFTNGAVQSHQPIPDNVGYSVA